MTVTPTKQASCRICGNTNLEMVLDLGIQALTGVFPRNAHEPITEGPLQLVKCHGSEDCCGLVQLGHNYDTKEMYGAQYGYRSGLNGSMVEHLSQKVQRLVQERPVGPGDIVLDIGSNDGTTLGFYPPEVVCVGIDPTTEKFKKYHKSHIIATSDFFSTDALHRAVGDTNKKAKIITSISMFYDLPSPMRFVQDVANVLADDGIWHLEQSYLPSMLETNGYDTVCQEHVEYYSLTQIQWMTSRAGLRIVDVSFNEVNGGSFAVTVRKGRGDAPVVDQIINQEKSLTSLKTWIAFSEKTKAHKSHLVKTLTELRNHGKKVYGLGASTKGNVLLQYCGIDTNLLTAIGEVNPDKFGCVTPGTHIPICSEEEVFQKEPDVLVILPWHFKNSFVLKHQSFVEEGGRLLFPLPQITVVDFSILQQNKQQNEGR